MEGLSENVDMRFRSMLYQTEMERIKFIIRNYLRTRLYKVFGHILVSFWGASQQKCPQATSSFNAAILDWKIYHLPVKSTGRPGTIIRKRDSVCAKVSNTNIWANVERKKRNVNNELFHPVIMSFWKSIILNLSWDRCHSHNRM
jgi:hypothetical protein